VEDILLTTHTWEMPMLCVHRLAIIDHGPKLPLHSCGVKRGRYLGDSYCDCDFGQHSPELLDGVRSLLGVRDVSGINLAGRSLRRPCGSLLREIVTLASASKCRPTMYQSSELVSNLFLHTLEGALRNELEILFSDAFALRSCSAA